MTLETGRKDISLDFYHPKLAFDFGDANDLSALVASVELGGAKGCVPVTAQYNVGGVESEGYRPCAHVIPEMWSTHALRLEHILRTKPGVLETPTGLGLSGQNDWIIPLWTLQKHPQFGSYLGFVGEANRKKAAETFKRPTTWGDYCAQESLTFCAEPDNYASRPPRNEAESTMYYAGWDVYKGYFRKTEENNCEAHPDTCTGHFADYPCASLFQPPW